MQAKTDAVECQVRISASQETVYSYFTDASKMVRWKGVAAKLDPQPGGEYYCDLEDGIVMMGKFLEVDPFKRLVFSFGWKGHAKVPPSPRRLRYFWRPCPMEPWSPFATTTSQKMSGTCTRRGGRSTWSAWKLRRQAATQDRT
jgi:uncharacterized protein YndB with AHSA1/START domain